MPPETATIALTRMAWTMKRATLRPVTGTPSEEASSGPVASASSHLDPIMSNSRVTRTTTAVGTRVCQEAPATLPNSQKRTDWADFGSLLWKTRKLDIALKAEDMTTPVRTSRKGLRPPWAMAMPNTAAVATRAPRRAPMYSEYTPKAASVPVVMTAVAPTLAPAETPSM